MVWVRRAGTSQRANSSLPRLYPRQGSSAEVFLQVRWCPCKSWRDHLIYPWISRISGLDMMLNVLALFFRFCSFVASVKTKTPLGVSGCRYCKYQPYRRAHFVLHYVRRASFHKTCQLSYFLGSRTTDAVTNRQDGYHYQDLEKDRSQ